MKKRKYIALDAALVVLTALLTIGALTFFSPCGIHDDGTYGTCHWAGAAAAGIGAVMLVLAVIHLIAGSQTAKKFVAVSMIPSALLSALIPGTLIPLCMMAGMRCNAVMRPSVTIISIVIIIIALLDAILRHRLEKSGDKR
ncbi:MAG: DUF4418 family protein [Clostridia bacterium]|jgi:uncharacterized PurR-regulated membrane protein YhhQ (DUF165 family)|nr:DUF4418 family protein [Clostridia bacterium]